MTSSVAFSFCTRFLISIFISTTQSSCRRFSAFFHARWSSMSTFLLLLFAQFSRNACVRFAALFLSTSILPIGTSIVFVLMACSSDGRVVGHRLPCTHDYCLIQVTIVSAIPVRFAAAQSRTVTETQVFSTIIDCFLPSCYHER